MIKNIFIDIDNTLLDFDKCARQSIIDACKKLNIEYFEEIFTTFISVNDGLWLQIEKGTLTKQQLHDTRFAIIFNKLNIKVDGILFENTFRSFLFVSHEHVDGAKDILEYLSKKYNIYAVSNAAHSEQIVRLEKAGLSMYIKDCFVSEIIGAEKPSKKFFDYCVEKAKIKKEETILIGDSLTADIYGAKKYGLTSIWFNKKGIINDKENRNYYADYVVENLKEIKEIL